MNPILENTLIAAVLLIILILPFTIASRRLKRQRKEKMNAILIDFVQKHHLTLTRSANIGNQIIGWDAQAKSLLCVSNVTDPPQYIDLKNATNCRIDQTMNKASVRSIALLFEDRRGRILAELFVYRQFNDSEMMLKNTEQQAAWWATLLNAVLQDSEEK